MKYVLQHKKYKTLYCCSSDKCKWSTTDIKDAKKFDTKSSSETAMQKMKHSENWEILEVKNEDKSL